ncbi:MAG TPA: tetratricopeptide repeat protein [Gemmataceae bacterium]|nr:tetratricopeptide repeat protein [Gemmataceae bacterium]
MAQDPYGPCNCGSGKKFKWCCQPIFVGINRAWEQEAAGQHDTALRLMDQVVKDNESNPEVWGQKARLLYSQSKVEEAETALQKAFDLNPNYPAGLLLRASFRFQEGEVPGALLLARRAADAYDPEARSFLAEVYYLIFECEMRLNRPVAARAALNLVTHYAPAEEDLRKSFDAMFGPEGRLPAIARRAYTFRSPASTTGPKRTAWDQALQRPDTPHLGDLVRAFEGLTKDDASDTPAWFNLGLAHAWLGDNPAALEALQRYVEMEADENAASEAAALMEVLRCGQGQEEQCDYQEHAFGYQFRDPQPVVNLLQEWDRSGRLVALPTQQEGMFMGLVLEMTTASLITVGAPAADAGRLGGYVVILGNLLQVTSPLKEPFDRLREEIRQRLALGVGELQERRAPIQFQDVVAEALLFPLKRAEDSGERVLAHAQKHYEETWIHKPRRSLAGNAPIDAAAHPKLRKQLRGVVQFIQDCAQGGMIANYDFDRLRRKLGLLEGGTVGVGTGETPVPPSLATLDIASMGASELARLDAGQLSDEQMELAYQTAVKLDAGELAAHFAGHLIGRPPRAEQPDRFPWYSYLTQHALKIGDTAAALDYVDEGEKADCEHNEGRRRNDYELRRGQVHVKRGEAEEAADVFQRLIERVPSNFRYRGSAAEAMLALKQGARALRFAEEGVTAARLANDRDSEQYLLELASAAKKQMG